MVLPAELDEAALAGLGKDGSAELHEDANKRRPVTGATDRRFAVVRE